MNIYVTTYQNFPKNIIQLHMDFDVTPFKKLLQH